MATGWSSSKKENTNFARLCWLLVDGGTHVLKDVFDSIHPPSSLHSVLHSPAVHNTLQRLRRRKVLTGHQWDRLYPRIGTTVTSAGFDITLLFVLLRSTCGLNPPPKGWDNTPASSDKSKEADLVRLKLYRNELYGHVTKTAVSDSEFEKNWTEISDVLIRLGGTKYKPGIERLKVQSMDSQVEKYFIKTLEEWEEAEKDLKMAIKESKQQVMDRLDEMEKNIGDRIAEKSLKDCASEVEGKTYVLDNESTCDEREDKDVFTRVQDYTNKLKKSINKHTDFLPSTGKEKKIRIDDIFTDLTLQRSQKRFEEDQAERKNRSEMFICLENEDPQSTATVKTNPKSILLIGKAGIGKTLFCRKLVRDWANDSLFEKEEKSKAPIFGFTLLLTFRQLSLLGEEKLCLRDILNCSSLLDERSVIDEALLQYMIENPEKLLLIIDGYDEYNYRDKITSDFETRYPNDPSKEIPVPAMIAKLLKGKILQDSVVLISSRPGEAEAVKEITFDATFQITGFSSLQAMKYVENYFQENESLKNAVLDHIKANKFFSSFGEIPVMCFIMCCYMEWHVTESRTATTLPVTRTNLYHEVIKVFIKKHHGDSKYREMTETEMQETLLKLAELAFNLTREKKYIFKEEDIKKLNLSESEITRLKASGLLDCCPSVKTSPFDEPTLQLAFTHPTIQEYLCAVRCVEIKQMPDTKETSGVTLIFVAELLSRNKNENFQLMKELVERFELRGYGDNTNKLLVLNVLHEYGDKELSKLIIDNLYDKYFYGNELMEFSSVTYVDCVSISHFLDVINLPDTNLTSHKHSRNTFMIGNSSLSSSGVQVLCQSLVHHKNITTQKLLGCKLDDKCVDVIAKHLVRTKITHLLLWGNNITDVGVKSLCDVLIKPDCCVEVLDLRSNRKITDKCKGYRNVVQKQKPRVKLYFDFDKILSGDGKEKEDTKREMTAPAEVLSPGPEAKETHQQALDSFDNQMDRPGDERKKERSLKASMNYE